MEKVPFKYKLAYLLVVLLSKLPYPIIRSFGKFIGRKTLLKSKGSGRRIRENLLLTGLATPENVEEMAVKVAESFGRGIVDMVLLSWAHNNKRLLRMVQETQSFKDFVAKAKQLKRPIMFLIPHLGSFELPSKTTSLNHGIEYDILYKPSKNKLLNYIMLRGRSDSGITMHGTTRKGLLGYIKALKDGHNVVILPDSVAGENSAGAWVKFFGQDAYATTLAAKLMLSENTLNLMVSCIQTDNGFEMLAKELIPSKDNEEEVTQEIYNYIEEMVRYAPEQYFWSYDRFRSRKYHKPKDTENTVAV